MAASAVLHVSVLLAGIIAWPWLEKPAKVINVVPVTLMTKSDMTDVRSAVAAPEPAPAQTEEPVPDAPPEMTAPIPQPEPAPPQPQPAPQPKPAPPKPTPVPAKPTPAKPVPPDKSITPTKPAPTPAKPTPAKPTTAAKPTQAAGFDFDALAASIAKAGHPAGQRTSSAQKGLARPETDTQSRPSMGAARAATADAVGAIASKLARLWSPNCGVEGAANVVIKVRMKLTPEGRLAEPPALVGDYDGDPVTRAAAVRALNAVSRGAPFDGLPPETYADWRSLPVKFDAKQICQGM